MRTLIGGLAISVGIYLLLLLLLYLFQRQFLYFPDPIVPTDQALGQMDVAAVDISSRPEGRVRSLWWAARHAESPVFLFLHGNAGSHYNRIPIYQALAKDGAGVLGVGYPGFGGNAGIASESALFENAQDNYDWLMAQDVAPDRIVIIGESLGSGVATHLASQNDAAGLILIAAYTGMDDLAQRQFPIFPARYLVKDRYRSIDRIDRIGMPLAWIHGKRDQLIPFAMGQRLFDAANVPKSAHAVEQGGHNDLWIRGLGEIILDESQKMTRAAAATANHPITQR